MTIARFASALVVLIGVAGCENYANREQAAGAAVGQLLELKIGDHKQPILPTASGSLLGAYRGSEVGKSLDDSDRRHAEDAAKKSLATAPAKNTTGWRNPNTGHTGTFTPTNSYRSDDRLRCRDYKQSITAEGRSKDAYGTACQTADGSWRMLQTPVRRALRRRR
ncbi:MAG: RT0821/Lpp0805 family surface protein [Alphaproteobacteria bacterium]|nr:RT0821/Lpp0805 family surface protein [Alphaproteobacteria bacterium]